MAQPDNLPPVGATVVDADGCRWRYTAKGWFAVGLDWGHPADKVAATILTALWRVQQERDQLKADSRAIMQTYAIESDQSLAECVTRTIEGWRERCEMAETRASALEVDSALLVGRGAIIDELTGDVRELQARVTELETLQASARADHEASVAVIDTLTKADELALRLRAICQQVVAVVGADGPTNAEDAVSRALARVTELEPDARRWRWLRAGGVAMPNGQNWEAFVGVDNFGAGHWVFGRTRDEAVDAAIAAQGVTP